MRSRRGRVTGDMSKNENDDAVSMPKDGADETLPSEQASQVEEQATHVTEASSDMVPADGETEKVDPGLPANFPTNVPVDVPVSVHAGDLSETAVIPALGAATIAGDADPGGSRRVSRGLVAGVTAGVLVLAAGGITTWGVLDHRSWNDEVSAYEDQVAQAEDQVGSSLAAASDAYDVAAAGLAEAVTGGEEVLSATEGQVTDNAVREDLRSALDAAIALTDEEGANSYLTEELVVPAISRSSLFVHDEREAYTVTITTSTDPSPAQLGEAGSAISTAVEAVEASHLEWARTQLTDAMTTGEEVLAASEGKVDDNAVREGLRSALDAAAPVRDAEDSGAQALLAARDAVNAATSAVTDAQSAWQAEQDRIAAQKAAAERAAAQKAAQKAAQSSSGSSGNKGTSSSGKGTSSGSSGSSSGSSGSAASSGSGSGSSSGGGSGSGCLSCGGNFGGPASLPTSLAAWGCPEADTLTYAPGKGWTKSSALADAKSRGCTGPFNYFGEWY